MPPNAPISYMKSSENTFCHHSYKISTYKDPAPAKNDTAMTAAIKAKLLAPCSTLAAAPVVGEADDELEVPVVDPDPDPEGVPEVPGP